MKEFDAAKESIHLAVYSFTSDKLANALARAVSRGVEVKVVADYSQSFSEHSVLEAISSAGVQVRVKKGAGLMHNKFAVIDESRVATGSFNYTKSADERNDENIVLVRSEETAALFGQEFLELWSETLG